MPSVVRILVLSNKCPPDYDGGYELSAFQVAGALRQRGYDVQLLTSKFRSSFKGSRDSDPDWVQRRFDYREWPNLSKKGPAAFLEDAQRVADLTNIGLANAEEVRKFVQAQSFDMAYCFGLHGVGLATASPLAEMKMPTLWHAGNYLIAQDLQLKGLFKRKRFAHRVGMHLYAGQAMKKIFAGDYSHIAFLSEAMKREFVSFGFTPTHSYIIPRGIDFPLSDLSEPRTSAFLMASRISPEKGYDVVLNACKLLEEKQKGLDWNLRIAGPGSHEYIASLKSKAKVDGFEDRVDFLGMLSREQVLEEMRHARAFISASLWEEPFGRSNIEALACGAPLIAADTGAIPEIVGDSNCAMVYAKHDPKALAHVIQRVVNEPDLRSQLARKGIERIKNVYTMDRILDMTEDVFTKVMADYGKAFTRPSLGGKV